MTSLVDLHCHLDLFPNFEEMILECEKKKIYTLTVTTTPQAWPRNFSLTKNCKYVRAALGLHPQLVRERASELSLWDKFFSQAKYIGEIGLDAGRSYYSFFQEQVRVFDHIINRCAVQGGKVLTIHSVKSATNVLSIIKKHNANKSNKIVLHWFSGSIAEANQALELDCFFSVNSQMLMNEKSREILKTIPIDRILTETDAPFTVVKQKQQMPEDVSRCLRNISSLLKRDEEEIKLAVERNFEILDNL